MKAREWIRKYLLDGTPWPEDDWVQISEDWDLNLWLEDGKCRATLYRVVDGNACTDEPVPVI